MIRGSNGSLYLERPNLHGHQWRSTSLPLDVVRGVGAMVRPHETDALGGNVDSGGGRSTTPRGPDERKKISRRK